MILLDIRDLYFTYPDGRQALCGVNVQVRRGEKIALVGPNGAGKSTLMLHCNGILRGRGAICVAGEELNDTTVGRIRATVGLVFQDPDDQLFSPTVFEDVAFGPLHMGLPEAEVRRRVDAALDAVGMLAYRERISHHLSTGEKKRIAIATVLSMQPQLLVLDEPTAGLDPRARRSLIELLKALDLTMIVSTHDMPMIPELFPRMVVMDGGCVVADGPSAQLLEDQALLARHGLEYP
jgi:cobalt/nickel transport system ATP-binding protein